MLAHSEDVLNSHKHALLLHLESLGLCANKQKSVLCPSQSIMYLGDLKVSASELGAHMRFDVRSECIQIGPSRGTEGISEAHGSDGGGRDGMSPRAAVYTSPPDKAESTGAEEGVEIGPCPRCGHSPVLERAVTMVEPRPVPARRPDGCVRDGGKHSLSSVPLLVTLSPRRGRTHDAVAECPSVFVPPLKILSKVLHKIREEKVSALLDALY